MRIEAVQAISESFRSLSALSARATSARSVANGVVHRQMPPQAPQAAAPGSGPQAASEAPASASASSTADAGGACAVPSCPPWPTLAGQPLLYVDQQLDTAGRLIDDGFDFVGGMLDAGGDLYNNFTDWTPIPFDDLGGDLVNGLSDLHGQGWDVAGDLVEGGADLAGDVVLADGRVKAEIAIRAGDRTIGRDFLDTPLEVGLLRHWLGGTGETVELSGADWNAVVSHPATVAADPQSGRPVTLEDGTEGRAVLVDFDQAMPGGASNSLDGSLGRATLYFDGNGQVVGIYDSYDFSNDNKEVDVTNAVGGAVGAKNFVVRGGVIEEDPPAAVPCPPHMAQSLESLMNRIG